MKKFAIIALAALAGICSCVSMLDMKPVETGKIAAANGENSLEIYALKNNIGTAFFIKADEGYIMFDAGTNAGKFSKSLSELGIGANDVKWIFLTHSDGDHVASLPLFPDAPIRMYADELQMVNGTAKRNAIASNKMPAGIDINKIILLSDGQELSVGGVGIRCFAAPGHTPGSMMYLINGDCLITGDVFSIKKGKIGIHPFTMDEKTAKATIERLGETISGSPLVLTSHFGLIRN